MNPMTLDLEALTVETFDVTADAVMLEPADSDSACPTGCACCTG